MYLPYYKNINCKYKVGDKVRDIITGEIYEITEQPNKRHRFYRAIKQNKPDIYYFYMEDEIELLEEQDKVKKRIYRNTEIIGQFEVWSENDISLYHDGQYTNKVQSLLALADISPQEVKNKEFRISITIEEV